MKQLRKIVRALPILALPLVIFVAGACGSVNSSTGTQLSNADLVGDWTLVSFQVVPQPALTPPGTNGALHLGDSTYKVVIVMNNGGVVDTEVADSGTYSVNGTNWTQTANDPQNSGTESIGVDSAGDLLTGRTTGFELMRRKQ